MSMVCRFLVLIVLLVPASGCSRAPINPARLVMTSDSDMSIQLFMQATILLANYYGFSSVRYGELRARTRRAGIELLPFMPPETMRATPELRNLANDYENDPDRLNVALKQFGGYRNLVKYYIRTGLRASQSICRSYLLDIEEKSEFLDFIEKEVGVGYALSSAVLALVHANPTLTTSFLIARTGADGALGAYQDYRYLNIDRESARALVEAAQNAYAKYFLDQVDISADDPNAVTGGFTFSDALHAVSTIEYQCTRSGMKNLLARSVNNSPANLVIDTATGTMTFRSAVNAPIAAEGPGGIRNGTPRSVATNSNREDRGSAADASQKKQTARSAGEILIAALRSGTAEERKEKRQKLQELLADDQIKSVIAKIPKNTFSNPSSLQIEEIAVSKDGGVAELQSALLRIAREKRILRTPAGAGGGNG